MKDVTTTSRRATTRQAVTAKIGVPVLVVVRDDADQTVRPSGLHDPVCGITG